MIVRHAWAAQLQEILNKFLYGDLVKFYCKAFSEIVIDVK